MANTVIKITFVSIPNVNDNLRPHVHLRLPPYTDTGRGETFKTARSNNGEVKIESTLNAQAATYAQYFNIDYNTTGDFEVSVTDNVVTISCSPTGSFDYFLSCEVSGSAFATYEFFSPELKISGLAGDRYYIDNEIWVGISSNTAVSKYNVIVQNLFNNNAGAIQLYAGPSGVANVNLQPIIKSLFEYPQDASGYVINDQIVPNANDYKITASAQSVAPFELTKTFVRGGVKTNEVNISAPQNIPLRPCDTLPVWSGYDTADYYLDNVNVMRKRLLSSVSVNDIDYRRTPKSCNVEYVKFKNQQGGYSTWLFESHSESETNSNQGSFIRNNVLADLGNESESRLKIFGKIPERYKGLINSLIVSPDIYLVRNGQEIKVISGKNTFTFDDVKRVYNVSIDIDLEYRYNPSTIWSS